MHLDIVVINVFVNNVSKVKVILIYKNVLFVVHKDMCMYNDSIIDKFFQVECVYNC